MQSTNTKFNNNGLLDSLTGTPAPKIFLDNLSREIARSRRKFQALSIMTIKIIPPDNSLKIESAAESYNHNLIAAGQVIKSQMRSGDFFARIADDGFWVCLQGNIEDAEKTSSRFTKSLSTITDRNVKENKGFSFLIGLSEWSSNIDPVAWVCQIDSQYFGQDA